MEDGSLDVDDLFGDPNSLDLGLPAAQPPKGLAQRLDEMRLLGCCQKVAWSRLGCIAYISQDGQRVNVRYLHCRPSDGKWVLSDDHPIQQLNGGNTLVHLSWNEPGSELAVVDASGRVSIFSIALALNNISMSRQIVQDQADDGAQVVGMAWLNAPRAYHAFHQASKLNVRWEYSSFRRRPIGPFHPANKSAILCVTRSGVLRFLYQNPDNRWAEISTDLKTTAHSDRILTHAAILPTPGGILVTTHSAYGRISLYRLQVTWTPNQWEPQGRPPSNPNFPVPAFRISQSKIEHPSLIFTPNREQSQSTGDAAPPPHNPLYFLTRLEVIPGQSENTPGSSSGPLIMAVYSVPAQTPAQNQQQNTSPSVIVRWQLETTTLSLHPVFEEVIARKANIQAKTKVDFRRLQDIYMDRHIISIEYNEFGNVLVVVYDDGSITFYDARTMTLYKGMGDTNTVTSMAQAGFQYPLDTAGNHICFSPNGCLAVVLDPDWQPKLRMMEHSFGQENGSFDENKYSAAIAALALTFSRGCGSDLNTDDILMIVLQHLNPEAQTTFISEVYRALPLKCDFTTEQDKLMQQQYIPRCLSLQSALGFKNYFSPRTLSASLCWWILHIRHACIVFTSFLKYKAQKENEPHDLDVLRMVHGNVRWALDFSHYILDGLFELADELQPYFNDKETFAQKVKSTSSLPLLLVLCSMSRAFLRTICRGLRGVHSHHTTSPLSGETRMYYGEICQMISKSPVSIEVYEKLLSNVDSAVRRAYESVGWGENERPGPERDLLVSCRIHNVLVPAVLGILQATLPAIRPEIDYMAIYLADYSWLGVRAGDRRTEYLRRTRPIDIIKKSPIRPTLGSTPGPAPTPNQDGGKPSGQTAGRGRRRCTRCCEISGDVSMPRTVLWFRYIVLVGTIRQCPCGGLWALETAPSSEDDMGGQSAAAPST